MEPYYDDGTVTIYNADVRELEPGALGEVSAAVFSPPYNVGYDYGDGVVDTLSWQEYRELADATMAAIRSSLVSGGRVFANVCPVVASEVNPGRPHSGSTALSRTSLVEIWAGAGARAGLELRDMIAWISVRASGCAWGSWETPNGPNLRGNWETILVSFLDTWYRETPEAMSGWRDPGGRWEELCSNVWTISAEKRSEGGHPAPYPVELASRCIRLGTWPKETVLDPFCGSGTTLRAAKDLGRRAVGVERSERFCEIAAKRCAAEQLFSLADAPTAGSRRRGAASVAVGLFEAS